MKIVDEYESNLEGEGINIVPMIDVIFAILTFFIISSLDLIRLDNIPVNLPKASTSTLVKEKPIVLTIDRENNIFLENKPINSKILVDQIKKIISNYSTNILVISADKEVAHGKVVEVIDQVRSIDNLRIGMSTDK
ncbi:ExbD/TolR family protein [Prochlorococcus sp. MIT 1011]|uniref:ExbD/TolR family protein n=1 Tax=Prochlorococcus sp. MIT 1011 TaxID=3082520 RepID=UPI0039B4ED8D